MELITNNNHINDLHNVIIGELHQIEDTNLVYELINIDEWNYVAIKHRLDDYHGNSYYDLSYFDMELNHDQFVKMILAEYIKTMILEIAVTTEDIVDMLDTLIN